MSNESKYQIWFMPWADIESEIKIGNITFWPFREDTKGRIKDQRILKYLENYFQSYVDLNGKPVKTIAVCTHGLCDFRTLNETEIREMCDAHNARVFSKIAPSIKNGVIGKNKRSMGPPSSDCYNLLTQNFDPASDNFALRCGSITYGGYKIGELTFVKPPFCGGNFPAINDNLLSALDRLALSSDSDLIALRERMFRSMEWFRLAHSEYANVSILSKIVMMCTAFEIILQVPNKSNKKSWIANKLDELCKTKKMSAQCRELGGKIVNHTKLAWWAYDFYDIRNAVVHGDQIDEERLKFKESQCGSWLNQLIVADLVYWECVIRLLFQKQLIYDTPQGHVESQNVDNNDEIANEVIMRLEFDRVHKALGWREPENSDTYGIVIDASWGPIDIQLSE